MKIHNINWCERGLQLADIATKNVSENDLNTRMKYIIVRIKTDREHLHKGGDRIQYSL